MHTPTNAEVRLALHAQKVFVEMIAKEAARNPDVGAHTKLVLGMLPTAAGTIGVAATLDGLMSAYMTIAVSLYWDPRLRLSVGDPVAALREALQTVAAAKAAIDNNTPLPKKVLSVKVERNPLEPVGNA